MQAEWLISRCACQPNSLRPLLSCFLLKSVPASFLYLHRTMIETGTPFLNPRRAGRGKMGYLHVAVDSVRGFSCLQPVGNKIRCGVPAAFGVENDEEKIAPVLRNFGNEASPGFGGKSSFDAFDTRDSPQ
jgi:hypothetical protein